MITKNISSINLKKAKNPLCWETLLITVLEVVFNASELLPSLRF